MTLAAVARGLPAARTGHVRLRLGRAGLRGCARRSARAARCGARVTVVAVGPTGRRTTVRRTYLVTR